MLTHSKCRLDTRKTRNSLGAAVGQAGRQAALYTEPQWEVFSNSRQRAALQPATYGLAVFTVCDTDGASRQVISRPRCRHGTVQTESSVAPQQVEAAPVPGVLRLRAARPDLLAARVWEPANVVFWPRRGCMQA